MPWITPRRQGRLFLAHLLLLVTLSVTTAELIELQTLPPEQLRARFKLASSCQPTLTALATDPTVSRVTVLIECRSDAAPTAPRPVSGPDRRQ